MADAMAELEAMKVAFKALQDLDGEQRTRAMDWLAKALDVEFESLLTHTGPFAPQSAGLIGPVLTPSTLVEDLTLKGPPGTDSAPTPKAFLAEKRPQTMAERIACLAYFLTHYRHMPSYKATDLSDLNTEAAQPKIGNLSRDLDNATRGSGFLTPALTRTEKQITVRGEAVVEALPSREAVKAALADHNRPRVRRPATKRAVNGEALPRKSTRKRVAGQASASSANESNLPTP